MDKNKIVYNKIDFIVKAPRFRIAFSYTDQEGLSFIREFLLKLLKLKSCTPEDIAGYLGLSEKETLIAIDDLIVKEWVQWKDGNVIELTANGSLLFKESDNKSPQIPTLSENTNIYSMELIGNNFISKQMISRFDNYSIELPVDNEKLSQSKMIAKDVFQQDFLYYKEENIIDISDKDESARLYKVDFIEQIGNSYFNFTQDFSFFSDTGEQAERADIVNIKNTDQIEQSITKILNLGRSSNLSEIYQSAQKIGDLKPLQVISQDHFDIHKFLLLRNDYEKQNKLLFVGQIYHQKDLCDEIQDILRRLEHKNSTLQLNWVVPSDIYWGKQKQIHSLFDMLNQGSKRKVKEKNYQLYDFKTYVPLPLDERTQRKERNDWKRFFRELKKLPLHGFLEGFLEGNVEIIILENHFVIVCYHLILSEYDLTLPIGFMTKEINEIKQVKQLIDTYLSDTLYEEESAFTVKYFGVIE